MQPITSRYNGRPQWQLAPIASIARNAMNLLASFVRDAKSALDQTRKGSRRAQRSTPETRSRRSAQPLPSRAKAAVAPSADMM
jgi:hypothetical protein